MSRLGDIENALVARLAAAQIGGQPVFATVRGASGGYRPALRDLLRRETTPAAYVAFIDEPTAPETDPDRLGARFSVLVAARSLRQGSDPRHGDDDAYGAFLLLDQTRLQLDDYAPATGLKAVNLHEKFIDADERAAVYELLYRIWPVPAQALPPGSPQSLTSSGETESGGVTLNWLAPENGPTTDPQDFYRIYRKRPSESVFTLHETAEKNALQKTLTSQPTGETLQYYARAVNTAGEGPASNTLIVIL